VKVTRWPALIVFIALIFGGVFANSTRGPNEETASLERVITSAVGSESDLVSIWYCVSGTVGGAGIADHQVILGNKSDNNADVVVTVVPVLAPLINAPRDGEEKKKVAPETIQIETVKTSVELSPRSVKTITVADLPKVAGEFAAVIIESNVGDLVVEHRVMGNTGSSQSNCQSDASEDWYFASGTTREQAREIISIYNPFADSAVVDMTFVADGRVRRPDAFNGLVIPPKSLLPVDITGAVTLSEVVSAEIHTRSGRVVAERLLILGDEFSPNGLSIEAGSPSLAPIWVFPGGVDGSVQSSIQVFNPSETEEVSIDIEIYPDFESASFIEPISIKVSPGNTETVVLGGGDATNISQNAYDLTSRIPQGIPHWIALRVISGPPIVSERFVLSDPSLPQMTGAGFGVDVVSNSYNFISTEGNELIAISHTSNDRLTQVNLFAYSEGEVYASLPFEISAVSRKVVNLEQFGIPKNSIVRIVSSEPVIMERYIRSDQGGYWTKATPDISSVNEPEIPLQEVHEKEIHRH